MTTKINITIPKPCHENWNAMTPVEKGRFCSMCEKKVLDFTNATNKQIIEAYNQDKNLCGRFLKSQLGRDLETPKEKKSIWLASVFFGLLSLSNAKVNAQEKPKTEQAPIQPEIMGKMIAIQEKDTLQKTISGIVNDEQGPIPGANITIEGTAIHTATDLQGKYTINAKKGDVLIFSFMGMNEVSKTIGESNIINTILTNQQHLLGEVVYIRKKTFLGRQFKKIKNWFR
ncbi:MAG: carboxypeptidase-like regulatory domain-containing protein [Limnohabitans sp.]|nr:carboxypeptidase-like regulatory domain-containing protein [Limnohabitans sp.]